MVSIVNRNSKELPTLIDNKTTISGNTFAQNDKNTLLEQLPSEYKDSKNFKNYKADDLKNKISFNMVNPLSPYLVQAFHQK